MTLSNAESQGCLLLGGVFALARLALVVEDRARRLERARQVDAPIAVHDVVAAEVAQCQVVVRGLYLYFDNGGLCGKVT